MAEVVSQAAVGGGGSGGEALALKTCGLTRRYGQKTVVSDLSLEVQAGDIYGFLGPNGAGKTTTMRLVLGMIRRDAGTVAVFGQSTGPEARTRLAGIVGGPRFYPQLSGVENLRILAAYSGGCTEARLVELLELVRLRERAGDLVKSYSTGMKQRLGIAQALLNDPDFLLLDEPMSGLDPAGVRDVRRLILELNQERGITVFVSSHILKELEGLCTRFGIVQGGRLVAEGVPQTLCREGEDLEAAFLRLTEAGTEGQIG